MSRAKSVKTHESGSPAAIADADSSMPETDEPGSDHNPSEQEAAAPAKEIGGRDGPDPTRYGDWEKAGRCIDF